MSIRSAYNAQFQTPYGTAKASNAFAPETEWGISGRPMPGGFPTGSRPVAPQQPAAPAPSMPGGFPTAFSLNSDAQTLPAPQFSTFNTAPAAPASTQTSAYGGAANSTQRWQEAALAGAKPLSSARIFNDMYNGGRIDGRSPQSSRDTTPSGRATFAGQNNSQGGFTPQSQWDSQFQQGQIGLPTRTPSKYAPNY